ncbi:helix-turn-helix transcriptional regulator [Pseudokineococcus lusitanus]|uniref:Putative DNA-binding transcriptional regulator YafY n=1 Tax=Pseudokineococcus lusitanus TaxID=763993 RepID=A0A3N1G9S7_9ACTN|nr:WYL domain-containing protein [Pseudokineococcus lusitanus]ROP26993.1 putative DNA-binding transcriptional regulator YafY [Pseudokineococcus lusitanus]
MSGTPGRLLQLLSLLQARRDWPGDALAERLEVSPRTVRRDVDRLRDLGYPVRASRGPAGGYRLDAGAELPPLLFDDDQAVALALALQLAAGQGVAAEAAERALATVRQVLPARLRTRVDAVRVTPLPTTGGGAPVDPAVLLAVTAAVRAREVLRCDLLVAARDGDDGDLRPPRRVEPHHVLARGGRWYLLAWDLDRDDWRTFRLDRLRPRTPTGPRFVPRPVPGGDPAAFVAALFRGSRDPGGAGGWPCRGEVVLAAPASAVAPYVGDGTLEPLDDDRCRLVAGSWSWAGLAASLARLDVDLEVVGPPELREAFAHLARRAGAAAGR